MLTDEQVFAPEDYLPKELQQIDDPKTAIPTIAKNERLTALIEESVGRVPTHHDLLS